MINIAPTALIAAARADFIDAADDADFLNTMTSMPSLDAFADSILADMRDDAEYAFDLAALDDDADDDMIDDAFDAIARCIADNRTMITDALIDALNARIIADNID